MKINFLILFGAIVAFSSCSTAYRSGQTPDDVYYSPAPQQNTYVSTASSKDQDSYYYRNNEEDYNIRRGIDNPVYRSPLSLSMGFGYSPYSFNPYNNYYGNNNFGYGPYGMKGLYNPYFNDFGYNSLSFYSPYNFYSPYSMGYGYSSFGYGSGFGYGYSPYYSPVLFSSKSVNTNTGARTYNLGAYNNNNLGNRTEGGNVQPIRSTATGTTPASGTNETGMGRVIRRVFSPSERNTYTPPANATRREVRRSNNRSTYYNNNTERRTNNNESRNNTYEAPQRSFTPSTPSSSSSSPSGSGSSGSAPVRTFRR
ncbi:MAG: hypothetical protein ABI366_00895 [Ginsengibacter sp.]